MKNEGIRTVCVDEKTGMQALERVAETLPAKPGRPEKREFEYERHGTQCPTANFEVGTGKIISPTIGQTRTEPEFAEHIRQTVATDAKAGWIFVCDNLNTHCSMTLVLLAATLRSIPHETLGTKGTKGILQSMATRRAFLADRSHRVRFVFVPKHTSWLNQVEIWFGVLGRRVLRRGNFRSLEDQRSKVLEFIGYYNRTMAKPYRWTYTGRPLTG